jgi:hypothetical protein
MDKIEIQEIRALLTAESKQMLDNMKSVVHDPVAMRKAFNEFLEFDKIRQQFEDRMVQRYSVNVLENLEKEARILRYLTIVLIGLTGVLAILTALLASGVKF